MTTGILYLSHDIPFGGVESTMDIPDIIIVQVNTRHFTSDILKLTGTKVPKRFCVLIFGTSLLGYNID
jgi:hypothetical protein